MQYLRLKVHDMVQGADEGQAKLGGRDPAIMRRPVAVSPTPHGWHYQHPLQCTCNRHGMSQLPMPRHQFFFIPQMRPDLHLGMHRSIDKSVKKGQQGPAMGAPAQKLINP